MLSLLSSNCRVILSLCTVCISFQTVSTFAPWLQLLELKSYSQAEVGHWVHPERETAEQTQKAEKDLTIMSRGCFLFLFQHVLLYLLNVFFQVYILKANSSEITGNEEEEWHLAKVPSQTRTGGRCNYIVSVLASYFLFFCLIYL